MKTETENQTKTVAATREIAVSAIIPDPRNRKDHKPEELKLLAESIKTDGLLQPIVVKPHACAGGIEYMIVAGERRWSAHQLLKRETIPARVIENESDLSATRKRAAENLHRLDLTAIEEARQFQDLADTGMTQKEIAEFAGASQPAVANYLRLLQLPPSVIKLIHEGKLTRAHGVALVRFSKWPKAVAKMAEVAVASERSAKDIERDELPFEWELERAKLIGRLWLSSGYSATKEMKEDPDWLVFRNAAYCFNFPKFEAEKKRQEEVAAKKQKQEAASRPADGKLSAAEKKAREQKIAKNKEQRALLATQLAKACAKVKASQDDATTCLLVEAFGWEYRGSVAKAAEALGIKLPDTIKKGSAGPGGNLTAQKLIEALGLPSAQKVAAAAIMIYSTERVLSGPGAVPDVVEAVAGRGKGGKAK